MKQEELIVDAFYAVKHRGSGYDYIFQNINVTTSTQPYMRGETYSKGMLNGIYNSSFNGERYRLATAQEILHLRACIKVNMYVPAPKSEIINEYEIY